MINRLPRAHPSSSNANGTTVLLPAPGGACKTTLRWLANAARNSGNTSSIGNPDSRIGAEDTSRHSVEQEHNLDATVTFGLARAGWH
jgi:hypothetical protein